VRVVVNLDRRSLAVWDGGRLVRAFPVGVGASATPTPTGRFMVTDRVAYARGSVYGGFALGLNVRQTHLPAGWSAGDVVGIHGTDDPASIGEAASHGCIRVAPNGLRLLRRLVPLGAPVVIRA
jgi:lipoprotein-anchoring transpeptidase ErfK/SrfK